MSEPSWLREEAVLAMHQRQLVEHGGAAGVREPGLLASALARPRHLAVYGEAETEPDLAALAAAYAAGIVRNHPFLDGNKRTAWVACRTFLALNGWTIPGHRDEKYLLVLGLAEGSVSEEDLAAWLRRRMERRSG